MSSFLLDTNVLSELRKPRPNRGLTQWVAHTNESALYLSSVSIGKLRLGIELLDDAAKRRDLEQWLIFEVTQRFERRILAFDAAVADRWGRLEAAARLDGGKLPVVDAMLAATAIHHRLTLVTRNERDFERCAVPILNPWT